MSEIKISQLGQAGTLTGLELVPIVQNNLTLRTTLNQIKSFSAPDISNNIIADANSTTKVPSVNAIKTYADGLLVGLLNDRGNYTPSVISPGAYPSSGGSGVGGAIEKGDIWFITGNGFLGLIPVTTGASVRALVNNPSPTTSSDWDILDAALIQSTLQSVLDNGNTALNQSIELYSATGSLSLNSSLLYINNTDGELALYSSRLVINNQNNDNNINCNVSNPIPLISIIRGSTSTSLQISDIAIQFNNSGYGATLLSANLTSGQIWTLPNATGTIALTNNVWNATGNAGTVAGTNFLGTTDAIDLVAKTNNTERLRILSTGEVKLSSLVGSGTRMVTASATGQLSTQAIVSPTLQTVTDAGNVTTNSVIVKNSASFLGIQNTAGDTRGMFDIESDNGRVVLYDTNGNNAILACVNLTGDREYQLPDQDGTFALLSDINPGNTWNVVGNVGTTAGTNFIGTTDAVDFVAKTNNAERLRILSTGEVKLSSLVGTGTRMVVADLNGQLSTQAIVSPTLQLVTSGTSKNLTNGINLQGTNAGDSQTGVYINAFGTNAANSNSGDNVNALGYEAAMNNGAAATYVNAFGYQAAKGNVGGFVNAMGSGALENNTGSNVNAFGNQAGSGNQINGATIFSNASMPSYADYAAASAAITTGAGGTVGCTYLYHDQATNSIGAVRL